MAQQPSAVFQQSLPAQIFNHVIGVAGDYRDWEPF